MTDYPLIEQLGLEVTAVNVANIPDGPWFVPAVDLEGLLEKAQRIYFALHEGQEINLSSLSYNNWGPTTHTALLLNIQPIEKKKCEHKAMYFRSTLSGNLVGFCPHCKKELKPENWVEIEGKGG